MDMSQYKEMFISEAREHLRVISDNIVALEQDTADREQIDSLFRKAHSIKGMAASMGYDAVAELAHKMEDFMDQIRKGTHAFGSAAADLMLEGTDQLSLMLKDVESGGNGGLDSGDLLQRLISQLPAATAQIFELPGGGVFEDAGETAAVEPPLVLSAMAPARSEPVKEKLETQQTVRVKTELLDHLINITGALVTNKQRLKDIGGELGSARLDDAIADLAKDLRQLHNEVLKVRMMPLAAITERFPRVVRDLAKKTGKDVVFEMEGKNIEFDRGIIEELSDPLIHILRNAVDHGLETAAERRAAGKDETGRIKLVALREKDQVFLTISDDGRGMDPAKLIASAVAKEFIRPEEASAISPRDAFMLTCIPGFSTASEITDVSGRGVGMDAVQSTIKSLGGSLTIESQLGEGTRIILKLPLTNAIINILLVKCQSLIVGVPVTNVLRTLEIDRSLITKRGKRKVFYLEDEIVPLLSLGRILGQVPKPLTGKYVPTLVTEMKGLKVGLVVDGFMGQQEAFVKPLGRPLTRLKGVNGGAILGDGRVIFLLDVSNLV